LEVKDVNVLRCYQRLDRRICSHFVEPALPYPLLGDSKKAAQQRADDELKVSIATAVSTPWSG